MCKVSMVPLLPWSLVRWYPGVEKYLHLSSAQYTWYQCISSGGLKPSSPSWSWHGSDKILQICSTYVFYIFYIFYILYVFYIFYVWKLQPPTTCSPGFQCTTSAIVWCSDQIRSDQKREIVQNCGVQRFCTGQPAGQAPTSKVWLRRLF